MAGYNGMILTKAGQQLQAQAQIGGELRITKIAVGDGILATGENYEDLVSLKSLKMNLGIQDMQVINGQSRIRALISNDNLNTGFFVREVGVFAKIGDSGTETLYSYTNASDKADYLPNKGINVVEEVLEVYIVVGNAQNVTCIINDRVTLATKQDIIEHKTASTLDHPYNSVTDNHIGNRTITDTVTAATGAGTITNLLSKLGNMIKQITGKSAWYTAPATTLQALSDLIVSTPGANKLLKLDANSKLPADVTGNAATATKLATARKINTVPFDGSADISLTPANIGALPAGTTVATGDWNNYINNGYYFGLNLANAPTSGSTYWYWVEVIKHADNYTYQQAHGFGGAARITWERTQNLEVWSDWKQIPTMDLVLPLTGGDMAGAINETMVTMASASTMAIGAAAGNLISVTGTTTITSFDTVRAGVKRTLRFASPLTLTHNALSLILPGNTNITVGTGDVVEFASFGSGNWRCTNYQPGSGYAPLVGSNAASIANQYAYSWQAIIQGSTWSRIASTSGTANALGYSFILTIRGTRSNTIYNNTFLISTAGYGKSKILQLSGSPYSVNNNFQIRIVQLPAAYSSTAAHIEIYDSSGLTSGGTQLLYCTMRVLTEGDTFNTYTSFTDGTTLPSPYIVSSTLSTTVSVATTDIVAPAGYGLGTTANNYTGDIDKTAWETGFYYVRITATGTKPNDYGHMIVMVESAAATIKQIWMTNITNDMQIRQCVNGVWSPWKKIATTDQTTYIVASSLGINGYRKWSDGHIEQWGTCDTGVITTFPIAFPTACVGVIPNTLQTTTDPITVPTITLTNFTATTVSGGAKKGAYYAIGY